MDHPFFYPKFGFGQTDNPFPLLVSSLLPFRIPRGPVTPPVGQGCTVYDSLGFYCFKILYFVLSLFYGSSFTSVEGPPRVFPFSRKWTSGISFEVEVHSNLHFIRPPSWTGVPPDLPPFMFIQVVPFL